MTDDSTAAFTCLAALQNSGWNFYPESIVDGSVAEIRGLYTWPGTRTKDALLFRGIGDALAVRTDNAGEVVWQREGGLVDLVEWLMTLPRPGHRLAPKLALGVHAPILWTPEPGWSHADLR